MNLLNLEIEAFSNNDFFPGEELISTSQNRYIANSPAVAQILGKINNEIKRKDKILYMFYCQKYAELIRKERTFQPNFQSITLSGNFEAIFDTLMIKASVEVPTPNVPCLKEIEIDISIETPQESPLDLESSVVTKFEVKKPSTLVAKKPVTKKV